MFSGSYFAKSYFSGDYFSPITLLIVAPNEPNGVFSGRIIATNEPITDDLLAQILREDEEILVMITAFMEIKK